MKKILRFLFVICLMLVVTNMQAQVKFGPTFGLNLSTMTLKTMGISFDPKTVVGFNVGVISEISVNENLAIQPGLLFSTKGSKYTFMEEEMTITPSFLEVPVNILYKIEVSSFKLFLSAGPYFGYGIGGKSKAMGESADISFGSSEEDDMKPFDFGVNIGAGLDLNNFLISAHYGFGIANLSPITTDDTEMKNKVIGFSVAYLFGK